MGPLAIRPPLMRSVSIPDDTQDGRCTGPTLRWVAQAYDREDRAGDALPFRSSQVGTSLGK